MILEISNLSVGYNKKIVVDDLSFKINPGIFYGIIGPNGAGKSTLFKAASGVLKPWNGSIKLKGIDIYRMPRRELASIIAAVPQFQEAFFPFRVKEFVQMGRYPRRGRFGMLKSSDHQIIYDALKSMRLEELIHKRIDELSGGELQRVHISQALAQEPDILMLDEPTSHLDIGHQTSVLNLIKRRCLSAGIPILMIAHDLNLAAAYCDSLLLLKNGRAFAEGTPSEVLTKRNIESVYDTHVEIIKNESSNYPHIFLKPDTFIHQ
ncbi:MAG TPA: ABC transporter ATP-binding protein [Desulfomonilia bacterium]